MVIGKRRFSVIMTSFNYESYIGSAIESVLTQTYSNFELLIVDDCSTDNSWDVINRYDDARVKAIRLEKNKGANFAYNYALSIAEGEYIACLDSDDIFMPNKLERQAEFLEQHPQIDICGTFVTEIDRNGAIRFESRPYSDWFNISVDLNDPSTWLWQNRVCHSGSVVRKELHDRLGQFNNKLIYTPDWQFWLRALVAGARFSVLREELVGYRNHGNNITHKSAHGTLIEHAETSAEILLPWLLESGRDDLIDKLWLGFLQRSELRSVPDIQNEIGNIFSSKSCANAVLTSSIRLATRMNEERSAALSERDVLLSERDVLLSERDTALSELASVYRSSSWRVTKPLRYVVSAGRSVGQIARQFVGISSSLLSARRTKTALRLLVRGDLISFQAAFRSAMRREVKRSVRNKPPEGISPCPLDNGQPLVSVIIPCFNYGRFVVGAIESVLAQTLKNVEVIVVDGGSTDSDTLEILKATKKDRTRILLRDGRHLVGDNRNYGIDLASGRYICCLDADDTLDATYLEKAVFFLETYGYDIVSTAINYVGAREGRVDIMECPTLTDMVDGNHVLTCAVFRKQLWEAVGGYVDVGIGKNHVAEDWDFWLRLAANGARIRNISGEYLFNYRIHEGGSLSSSADVKSLSEQRKEILNSNQGVLTPMAFKFSEDQQSRYLRCEPTQTALASCVDTDDHKMTLLLAMPYFLVGGAERLLSGLCKYLVNHGWRVIVVATLPQESSHGTSIDWFKASTSEVYSLPNFLELEEKSDFIAYLLASRRVDCLLNTGSRLIYELIPSLKKRNPSLSIVDFLFNKIGHVDSHMQFREFFSFALAENQEVFDWYIDVAGWSTEGLAKVTSGVDLSRLSLRVRPKALIEKYCIAPTELVVGFSGRFSEEKGPDVFVEVAKMCGECKNLRFVMTGAGPMADLIAKRIKELPVGTRFEFAGLVDDVDQYLALYDVLVLPSRFDGRPLVVMEALASGVPVIASDVGGLADLVSDGVSGYLVPPADARTIADRIVRLAEDRSLLATMKEGARKQAEEKLDANIAYQNFEASLLRAINTCIAVN